MNRREFSALGAAAFGNLFVQKMWAERVRPHASLDKFYFALLADTHIIDDFYVKGSENGAEDNESILLTTPRMIAARDLINSLQPAIEHVFIAGDFIHNYPSADYDFYFKNKTRFDNAQAIREKFQMPVHIGFGNHDYDGKHLVSKEMTHRLFEAKFKTKPYSVLDYKGYKFIHLNNFLGATQNPTSLDFHPATGSFGEEQLHWFEAQLQQHKPTFVFIHFPVIQNAHIEFADFGLYPLLQRYKDNIQLVVTGHVHRWMNFDRKFGPLHYCMASTRYDPNAYMLMEVDTKHATWRFMNEDLVEWTTHYSKPYKQNISAT